MRTILRHSIGAVITLLPEVLPELSASRLVEVDLEASVKDGSVYNIKYQDPFLVITVTLSLQKRNPWLLLLYYAASSW